MFVVYLRAVPPIVPIGAQYQHFQFGSIEVVIVTKRKETMALPQQLRGFRLQLCGSLRIGGATNRAVRGRSTHAFRALFR